MGRTRYAVFVSLVVVGMLAASAPSTGGTPWSSAGEGSEGTQDGNGTAWAWTGFIRLPEEVSVGPDERLRIGPGALVKATSPEARLVVEGSLEVAGTFGRPTVLRVPVVLEGGDAEADVRGGFLWPGSGTVAVVVGPDASLALHDSHVRAGGGDGVVVQAIPGHETPRRDVTVKGSLITRAGSGAGADPGAGAGVESSDESSAGLQLEMLGGPEERRGTAHGFVWVQGNRFVGNDVGVAVDGWDARGVRFQGNRFEDNRRGVVVEGGGLNLHDPVFRDNDLAAQVDDPNGTLHVRGSEIGLDDVDIEEGSSAQVGDQVVRVHPPGIAA